MTPNRYMARCVHLPRSALVVAAGGPEALAGRPLAIAPAGGGTRAIGEVSGTAQAQGVRADGAGRAIGEGAVWDSVATRDRRAHP